MHQYVSTLGRAVLWYTTVMFPNGIDILQGLKSTKRQKAVFS